MAALRSSRAWSATLAVSACALALAAGALGAGTPRSEVPEGTCSSGSSQAAQARELACLVTSVRAANGLRPLRIDTRLARAARLKLADNVRCGDFSHTACGRPFTAVFEAAGYRGAEVGENLAWAQGTLASPRQVLRSWLASPGHRANLLSPRFTEIGIALARPDSFADLQGVVLWATTFGAP